MDVERQIYATLYETLLHEHQRNKMLRKELAKTYGKYMSIDNLLNLNLAMQLKPNVIKIQIYMLPNVFAAKSFPYTYQTVGENMNTRFRLLALVSSCPTLSKSTIYKLV